MDIDNGEHGYRKDVLKKHRNHIGEVETRPGCKESERLMVDEGEG